MPASTTHLRPAAVAGTFYPSEAGDLRAAVTGYLRRADAAGPIPKALIVPHAGFPYSGPVAASGYVLVKPIQRQIERVVLLGPSHHVAFYGLAASSADRFNTPLGTVPLDSKAIEASLKFPQVHLLDQAHQHEHSLEVQLPFLQVALGEFSLIPFTIGKATTDEVAELLEHLWNGDATLIVVSSDLSHYQTYWAARGIDS